MYQYKAILKSTKETVAEGHTVQDVENQIVHFKRQQKRGEHTDMNVPVEIFHIYRNGEKEELVKII